MKTTSKFKKFIAMVSALAQVYSSVLLASPPTQRGSKAKPPSVDKKVNYTKCFGKNDWICIKPEAYVLGSVLEGQGPVSSSITRSDMGVKLSSKKYPSFVVDMKWSALALVLGPTVKGKVDQHVQEIEMEGNNILSEKQNQLDGGVTKYRKGKTEYNRGLEKYNAAIAELTASKEKLSLGKAEYAAGMSQLQSTYTATVNSRMQDIDTALRAAGLTPGTEKYKQKYELAYNAVTAGVKEAMKPYYEKAANSAAAIKAGEEKIAAGENLLKESAKKLEKGAEKLRDAHRKIDEGQKKLAEGKSDFQKKIVEANERTEKRYKAGLLEFTFRTLMFDVGDNTYLAAVGFDNVAIGYDRPGNDIGKAREEIPEMITYTGNGSPGLIALPGNETSALVIAADKTIRISNNLKIKITGWVSGAGMILIDGDQVVNNWFAMSNSQYRYFENRLSISQGGVKSCYRDNESQSDTKLKKLCLSVQASEFGATPSVDLKVDVVKDVYLFLATSYIGHSVQASGWAGRAQITAKIFENEITKVYISGFIGGAQSYQDYSRASRIMESIPAVAESVIAQQSRTEALGGRVAALEYGGALTAVLSTFKTAFGGITPQIGLEGKVRQFTIAGDYTLQDPSITLTFGMNYNDVMPEEN